MKQTHRVLSLSLLFAVVTSLLPAAAGAIGFGLGASYRDFTIDISQKDGDDVNIRPFDSRATGGSFVVDTAVASGSLFNYRLALGYEQQKFDRGGARVDRLTLGNTFGFAMLRSRVARVWIGPRINLGVGFDEDQADGYWNLNLGVAPVLGVNFHLGPVASLALELGYEVNYYHYTLVREDAWGDDEFEDYDGTSDGLYLGAVLLFRTLGDRLGDGGGE